MKYSVGMLLYGSSKTVGNVWIVVDDGQSGTLTFLPKIALLWDGRNKLFCNDFKTTKHDYIKTGSILREADPVDLAFTSAIALSNWPVWAQSHMTQYTYGAKPVKSNGVNLPIGVLKKVNKALGIYDEALTKDASPAKVISTGCPSRSTGEHSFREYTGITDHYEYCEFCDEKRAIR